MKLIKSTLKLPAKLALTPESVAQQKALLEAAGTVTLPTNPTEQQYAVSVGQDLRRHLNQTELQQIEGKVNEFQKADAERVRLEEVARAEELKRLQAPVETNGDVAQQEIAAYRQEQQVEELMRAPLPEPAKASGCATRQVMRWKCTDINALYAARPDLCTAPEPKASAINALCAPGLNIPGLELWYETDTVIRTR